MILGTAQHMYDKTQLYKAYFTLAFIFVCFLCLWILDYKALTVCMYLYVFSRYQSAEIIFCVTSNISKNWLSKFIALWFFRVPGVPTSIGLLSLIPSWVYITNTARFALYWYRQSHLPADLYNFLIFSKHICSYK